MCKRCIALFLLLALLLAACSGGKPADGNYTIGLTLKGGSGRASVQSPADLTIQDGKMTLTLIWSSANYDYVIVDGTKYEPITYEGGSTFRIPLKDLKELKIIGDTVAMSTPHEVEYTLVPDAGSLTPVK